MSQYAIVTGASQGIGKAMVEELALRKFNLVLIARSQYKLQSIADDLSKKNGIDVRVVAADLTSTTQRQKAIDEIKSWNIPLKILINNAGYGLWGEVNELSLNEQENMMELNMNAMVHFNYELVPLLKENAPAHIMNVCSTASYQAVAGLTIYAATKSFVLLYSRGLRIELAPKNISVTCLSPGTTTTGFMDRAGMTTAEMKKRSDKVTMPANTVAAFAIKGMLAGRNEIIPGFINKLSVALIPFMPKFITEKIAAGLYKK